MYIITFWVGKLLFVCEFGRLNAATVSTDEQINNEFNYQWNFFLLLFFNTMNLT